MRKRVRLTVIAALLALLALLCACGQTQPMQTNSTVPPETAAAPTAAPTEASSVSAATEPAEAGGYAVYAGAVEDFMLPIEEHSWAREHDPEYVMLHFTSAVVNNRNDPFNIAAIREIFYGYDVSIHYIIERDGTIRCYIPEDFVAWHAGEGTFAGDPKYTNKMNLYAIGIELVAIGAQEDMADYLTPEEYDALDDSCIGFTDAQYASLSALVADICQRNSIPLDRAHVIGHDEYTEGNGDPGELLDWSRVLPAQ